MKYLIQIATLLVIGGSILTSCGTSKTAYVDDIYYNPHEEARKKAEIQAQIEQQRQIALAQDTLSSATDEAYYSDYEDYAYADRINKFQNDEYTGDYYEEDPTWNMSVNMGFGTYGMGWGVGFGYGYGYYPYYDPWYSFYYPYYGYPYYGYPYYGYPYYGYYPPYCGCCYNDHYPGNIDDDAYHYGPRYSASTGSPMNSEGIDSRKAAEGSSNYGTSGLAAYTTGSRQSVTNNTGVTPALNELTSVSDKRGTEFIRTTSAAVMHDINPDGNSLVKIQEPVKLPTYTRTRTEAVKANEADNSRTGYTPSYIKTISGNTRNTYNNSGPVSGTNTRLNNTVTPTSTDSKYKNTRTNNNANVYQRSSTGSTYKRSSASESTVPSSAKPASSRVNSSPSNIATPRSSGSGYTQPTRSSSNSNYSAPKSSGSSGTSTPSRSSNSNSSVGKR